MRVILKMETWNFSFRMPKRRVKRSNSVEDLSLRCRQLTYEAILAPTRERNNRGGAVAVE